MEKSSEQRHLQKQEFGINPNSQEKAIISFEGNDPQTNKKWISYNSSLIRYGQYISNGAIARGTIPEAYQATESSQIIIDWKPHYPIPLKQQQSRDEQSIIKSIFLIAKNVPLSIFLVKKDDKKIEPIFLVKKDKKELNPIFLIKKSDLKVAYVVLLDPVDYAWIYNKELHACEKTPISEIPPDQKTYSTCEECQEDNLHCVFLKNTSIYGDPSVSQSAKSADRLAASHPGWSFHFYFGFSQRVFLMENPAGIWGTMKSIISSISGPGKRGSPLIVPPSNASTIYVGSGSTAARETQFERISKNEQVPCPDIAQDNFTIYKNFSGTDILVSGGSPGAVIARLGTVDNITTVGSYQCINHLDFFSRFQMIYVADTRTVEKTKPFTLTGYIARIPRSLYNQPGTNRHFPEGDIDDFFGENAPEPGEICFDPPIAKDDIWLEYVLFFEGKRFNSGVCVKTADREPQDKLNTHKFVLGVASDEIFFRIWNKAGWKWQGVRNAYVIYLSATTFLLNRSDLSVKSRIKEVTRNDQEPVETRLDYRFFHVCFQTGHTWAQITIPFQQRDIWPQAFVRIDPGVIDTPYNFKYGYYSGNLIKGSLDINASNNPDIILDIFYIDPDQLIAGKTWKEHIIKSEENRENANITVAVTRHRRVEVAPGRFVFSRRVRTERIKNLMRGLGISDNEKFDLFKIAGVTVYV